MISPLPRGAVYQILEHWSDFEWQIQGFGMLRTYLDGPGEPRLQVWDQRLAVWHNNVIHDHPWAFQSTIYAGMIFNQRYDIDVFAPGSNGHTTEIIPGTRGGYLSERPTVSCKVYPQPLEIYSMGESYSQTHREMHLTRYLPGTVTLITRSEREEKDIARIAWFGQADEQPPFINPYPATEEICAMVIGDCLKSGWLLVSRPLA